MTAANIVLPDAAGTPVDHTFIPMGYDPKGVFWFEDQSQASAIGYWRISVQMVRPPAATPGQTSEGRVYRVRYGLHEPILANITNSTVTGVLPAPQLAYTPRGFVENILPERTSLLDRQNLSKMLPLLGQNAQIKGIVENLTWFY